MMNIEFRDHDKRYLIMGNNVAACYIYKWKEEYEVRYIDGLHQRYYTPEEYPYRVKIYFKHGCDNYLEVDTTKLIAEQLFEAIKKYEGDPDMSIEVDNGFSWKSLQTVKK